MSTANLFRTPGATSSGRKKSGWIGVDIGIGAIKICQLQRTGGMLRPGLSLLIRAENNRPFDAAAFESGHIGSEIRRALQTHGRFQGRTAACLISMSHCHLRTIVTAKGTEESQRELISLELGQSPMSDAGAMEFEFWDAATPEQSEGRGMTQVHVVSIPRNFSDSVANNLLRARLQCEVLDAVPFAAVRASQMVPAIASVIAAGQAYAVVDWGLSAATLLIVSNGQPILARTLRHCGVDRILQAVTQRMKLAGPEADVLLTTYGVTARTNPPRGTAELQTLITELCQPVLQELIGEIQETLRFLKHHFPQHSAEHVCLLGGGAGIRNMAALLEDRLHRPVHVWSLAASSAEPVSPVFANAAALSALAWE